MKRLRAILVLGYVALGHDLPSERDGRDDRAPRVTLRFFDGCPHWRLAYDRLHEAGLADDDIRLERVGTTEDADRLGFVGSPTILVDGRDPFDATGSEFGLTCRVFETPGGLAGSPTVAQLREALRGP